MAFSHLSPPQGLTTLSVQTLFLSPRPILKLLKLLETLTRGQPWLVLGPGPHRSVTQEKGELRILLDTNPPPLASLIQQEQFCRALLLFSGLTASATATESPL